LIRSFRCRDTAALFADQLVPRFRSIERVARRKLLYLHAARRLQDLRCPPIENVTEARVVGSRGK